MEQRLADGHGDEGTTDPMVIAASAPRRTGRPARGCHRSDHATHAIPEPFAATVSSVGATPLVLVRYDIAGYAGRPVPAGRSGGDRTWTWPSQRPFSY